MKKLISLMIMLGVAIAIKAQMVDPVHFTSQLKMLGGDEAEIVFSAKIDKGWHLYSTELGSDGPISASFNANKMDSYPVGSWVDNPQSGKPCKSYVILSLSLYLYWN